MEMTKRAEAIFVTWHKNSPVHLPDTVRKWLATNSWWLVIIGIVLSVISAISSLNLLMRADSTIREIQNFATTLGITVPSVGANHIIGTWISVATIIVMLVVEAKAIQPLKVQKKAGWDLMFLAFLIGLIGMTISGVVEGALTSTIIGLLIGGGIGGFILFEIRHYFATKSTPNVSSAAKPTKTKSVPNEKD